MKQIYLRLAMLFFVTTLNAQTNFHVPQNVVLKTNADFAQYESSIIDAARWLEDTDLDIETEKRDEANAFVIRWMTGSSLISVEITQKLANLCDKNGYLLGIYLASYAREFLGNQNSATKFSEIKAGLTSMMKVYKKGIDIKKTPQMEQLIKLSNEQLDEYIKANFK